MKFTETPEEYKDKAEFTCKVCRAKFRAETGKRDDCSCRAIGKEYCPYIEKVIKQEETRQ